MGTLMLPTTGAVYVDTNTIIYRVEAIQPYLEITLPLREGLDNGSQVVITSELSLLEALVKPIHDANDLLQQLFTEVMYATPGFSCVPITREILEATAYLRATISIKTADAIHAATALVHPCTLFVTNDPAFRRVPNLPVVVLSDIAAAS